MTQTNAEQPSRGGVDDVLPRLDEVIADVVAPVAREIDRTGSFPRVSIDALAKAGVLGAVSSVDLGGGAGGLPEVTEIVRRLAKACSSTAMVVLMHLSAAMVLEKYGQRGIRAAIAHGEHLTTLAFSETGSRSHFWAPGGTARTSSPDAVRLDARKSWITSAGEADSYVWSTRPLAADGAMTLWSLPADTTGLGDAGAFDGFGLRGNASRPVTADGVVVRHDAMLGDDGAGLDIALSTVLPTFLTGSAAFSVGLAESLLEDTAVHLTGTRLEHLDRSLAQDPLTRAQFADLTMLVGQAQAFLADTLTALTIGRADATVRLLQVKAVTAEAASAVADGAMRLCGGAAFRKEAGIERKFRDALAARVMAPTTAALRDFVGRVTLGQPLFDEE